MFSLESPRRGNSNEYTQHAIINIKRKSTLNYPKYNNACSYGICHQGLKNEFEIAVVNEPSVFEPLMFFCMCVIFGSTICNLLMSKALFIVGIKLHFLSWFSIIPMYFFIAYTCKCVAWLNLPFLIICTENQNIEVLK